MDENYNKILERISKASGLKKEEIERKIEAKIAKLSGLISKEGAAQVVSAELGINFDNEKLKINELLPGMRKTNVIGKIIELFPVRTFERQGKQNKVANFIIADDTANIKVVLWDTNHIELIENQKISKGSVIEIFGGSVRENEIHLGSFSELKPSKEIIENPKTEKTISEKTISNFQPMQNVSTRAFIVQIFEPRFFKVCPECGKKPIQEQETYKCNEHGTITPNERALINIVLDDGTETIRSVLFHETIKDLGLTDLKNQEILAQEKQNLLGDEMIFSGNIRKNNYFNNNEFIINSIKKITPQELLKKLENKD